MQRAFIRAGDGRRPRASGTQASAFRPSGTGGVIFRIGRGTIHRALFCGGRGVATPLPSATIRRPVAMQLCRVAVPTLPNAARAARGAAPTSMHYLSTCQLANASTNSLSYRIHQPISEPADFFPGSREEEFYGFAQRAAGFAFVLIADGAGGVCDGREDDGHRTDAAGA